MKISDAASDSAPGAERRAFTLVELLAILAVVAVLIALRLPALANAERGTKIARCASNLRQFSAAMLVYAGENGEKLPSNAGVGFWAWDMPWNTGDQLNRCGAPWQVMYCPGTAPRFSDLDNFEFYNFSPLSYRVVGYALTLSGTATLDTTNQNPTLTPPAFLVAFGSYTRQLPSQRVLMADATISDSGQYNESQRYTYNYTSIVGGFSKAQVSPHLSGKFPLGGNLGMLDGHVEWRKFADMHERCEGGSPGFWW